MSEELLHTEKQGFSLIEIVLAVAIFAVCFLGVADLFLKVTVWNSDQAKENNALLLAEEGLEATRSIRNKGFASLNDGIYGLSYSNGSWQLGTSTVIDNIFDRSVTISTIDSNTKEVVSKAWWDSGLSPDRAVSLKSRLTKWRESSAIDWSSMTQIYGISYNGNHNGSELATRDNYVYMVRLAGSPTFVVVDISNPNNPITVGQLTLGNTNYVSLYLKDNYVYLASSNNTAELQIINVSNPSSPVSVGSYNAPGNGDGTGVFAVNNKVYLSRILSSTSGEDELYILDVSNPSSPAYVNSLNLEDSANDLEVENELIFLASSDNTREFQVIATSTSYAMSRIRSLDINNGNAGANATFLRYFNQKIALCRQDGRVYFIDVSNPVSVAPYLINNIAYGGGNPTKLDIFNNNKYLAVGSNNSAAEVKVYDITSLSAPSQLSSLNIGGSSNFIIAGLAYNLAVDKLVASGPTLSANNNYQLILIKGAQ